MKDSKKLTMPTGQTQDQRFHHHNPVSSVGRQCPCGQPHNRRVRSFSADNLWGMVDVGRMCSTSRNLVKCNTAGEMGLKQRGI